MSDVTRRKEMEIDIDLDDAHQRRWWWLQRAAWTLWAVLIAAAMIGVFGGGAESTVRMETAGGVRVDYDRFVRVDADNRIRLQVPDWSAPTLRLSMDRDYLDDVMLLNAVPPGRIDTGTGGDPVLEFPAVPGGTVVMLRLRPSRAGVLKPGLRLDGGPALPITQYSYP